MTDARSLALPADLAGLVDRLRDQARATVRASQMLADDKTTRNRIAGDVDANYSGVTLPATPEWQAANTITALSARVAELEAQASLARRMALEDALRACEAVYDRHTAAAKITPEFAWKSAADHCCDEIRAILSAVLGEGEKK